MQRRELKPQREELALTREEMVLTREEVKRSADAHEQTTRAMNSQIELARESATYEKMRYIDRLFLTYNSPEMQEHVSRAKRLVNATELKHMTTMNGMPNSSQQVIFKNIIYYLNHIPGAEGMWKNYASICYRERDSLADGDLASFQVVAAFYYAGTIITTLTDPSDPFSAVDNTVISILADQYLVDLPLGSELSVSTSLAAYPMLEPSADGLATFYVDVVGGTIY